MFCFILSFVFLSPNSSIVQMTDQTLFNVKEAVLKRMIPTSSNDANQSDPASNLLKTPVSGYDFNKGINYSALLQTYITTGFQATNFGLAIKQIELMVC